MSNGNNAPRTSTNTPEIGTLSAQVQGVTICNAVIAQLQVAA